MDRGGSTGESSRRRRSAAALVLALSALCIVVSQAWSTTSASAATETFGKTSVGASKDYLRPRRKRVNRYALPAAGAMTKLSIYLDADGTAGQQVLKGLVYADNAGAPARAAGHLRSS